MSTIPFANAGNNLSTRYTFNSAFLDFGTSRQVALDNVTVEVAWTELGLYVINSIKMQDLVRHSQKVTLTAKVKSFPEELDMVAYGSSTIGSPNNALTLDGQPTYQNPVVTLFDRNGKEYQYQFSNAIFKSSKMTAKAEDYSEWDIELVSIDVTEVVAA